MLRVAALEVAAVAVPEAQMRRRHRSPLRDCLTARSISDDLLATSMECGAFPISRTWRTEQPAGPNNPQAADVEAHAAVVVEAEVALRPLRVEPRRDKVGVAHKPRPQPRMLPLPEVVVAGYVAARLPSRGFLSCPGLQPSTTIIRKTNPNTIRKDFVCLPAGPACMRLLTRWSSSSNLNSSGST